MHSLKMRFLSLLILGVFAQACGNNTQSPSGPGACTDLAFTGASFPTIGSWAAGNNTVNVTVNDSSVPFGTSNSVGNLYNNEPTVSVTICSTNNPSQCQTIPHVLLDTGSFGLRLFKSVINIPLTPVTNQNGTLAECVQFGDGTSEFGPIEYAYVQMANEPKVAVPILAIQSDYGKLPSGCNNPDTSPADDGYNGILGVGVFAQDCGDGCVSDTTNGLYFTCQNGNCTCGASADLLAQVTNPLTQIPTDGNGFVLKLPSVAAGGVSSVSGAYLFLGIDTQGAGGNNSSTGKTAYPLDGFGQFQTEFSAYSNTWISSFLDTGSNALFFPDPQTAPLLPDCAVYDPNLSGFFCPSGTPVPLSAVNRDTNHQNANTVNFSIQSAYTLLDASSNHVFSTLGGSSLGDSSPTFDWGLPFFFGKNVFVGFENQSSSIGTGPYWAY